MPSSLRSASKTEAAKKRDPTSAHFIYGFSLFYQEGV
jgi:hypothetical protein